MAIKHRSAANPNVRRKPASEWATPGTFDPATDYESNVAGVNDGRALIAANAVGVLADAASSFEAKEGAKQIIKKG